MPLTCRMSRDISDLISTNHDPVRNSAVARDWDALGQQLAESNARAIAAETLAAELKDRLGEPP